MKGEKGDQGTTELVDYDGKIQEALQVAISQLRYIRLYKIVQLCLMKYTLLYYVYLIAP